MPPNVLLELNPSRQWRALCLGLLAVVCLLLPLSGAAKSVQCLVLAGTVLAVLVALRENGWVGGRPPPAVSHGPDGWRLREQVASDWRATRLRTDYLVTGWLVILRFQEPAGRARSVLVLPDMADPEGLRRLRMVLRWWPEVMRSA